MCRKIARILRTDLDALIDATKLRTVAIQNKQSNMNLYVHDSAPVLAVDATQKASSQT